MYESYVESNLRWAVNERRNEKKRLLYTKTKNILKLFLNQVTAGIEAHVVSENKFLYAYVKEVYRLWAQSRFDTFHKIFITVITTSPSGR
jgi:hypothetical protein